MFTRFFFQAIYHLLKKLLTNENCYLGKRSALTNVLKQKLNNVIVVGTEDLNKSSKLNLPNKFNLIINLFYSSKNK